MEFPFLTVDEHLHPFMQKKGDLTDNRLAELREELRAINEADKIIKVCEREFHKTGIANVLLAYNGTKTFTTPTYEHIIIHNYTDFIDPYMDLAHYDHDLTVAAIEKRQPFFICDSLKICNDTRVPDRVRAVEDFAYNEGIRVCLTFSLRTMAAGIAAVGLVARSSHGGKNFYNNIDRYGRDWWLLSCLMNSVIHEKRLLKTKLPKIHQTKLECLVAYGMGKTYQQVANEVGRAPKTVEEYMADMRDFFKADTSRQAFLKALEYGYYTK